MTEPTIIEATHNFNDALGDTIMEKNESLYVALMELRDKVGGGAISRMIVSKSFWEDNWGQVWMDTVFKPIQIPEYLGDGTIKVATFHDAYPVCVSDYFDDVKDWVMIICEKGVGCMKIEGFRV